MEKFIKLAVDQIEKIYFEQEKGDNFILHLIRSFIPIDETKFYLSSDKVCAITRKKGIKIEKLTEFSINTLPLRLKINSGTELEKEAAKTAIQFEQSKIQKFFAAEPDEDITQTRRMYYSDRSSKTLSAPALIALRRFTEDQVWKNNRNICYALKQERDAALAGQTQYVAPDKKKNVPQPKPVEKKASTKPQVNTYTVDAFQNLKIS